MKVPKLSWPQEALTGALEIFEEFSETPKLMLPGNHDGDGGMLGGSGLAPFRKHALVIERPVVVEWEGPTVAVAPWQAQRNVVGLLREAERRGVRTLLGHGFCAGVLLGPDEIRLPEKGLKLEDLGVGSVFGLVLMGDIHKGQGLLRHKGRPPVWVPWRAVLQGQHKGTLRPEAPWCGDVLYPGSPYQQTWGEREDGPKGALHVCTESGRVQFIGFQAPRFRQVELPGLQFGDMEKLLNEAEQWEGDFVRLQVPEIALSSGAAQGFIQKLQHAAKARWFHTAPIRQIKAEQRAPLHTGMTLRDMLRGYLQARPLEGLDPKSVLQAGLHLAGLPKE